MITKESKSGEKHSRETFALSFDDTRGLRFAEQSASEIRTEVHRNCKYFYSRFCKTCRLVYPRPRLWDSL